MERRQLFEPPSTRWNLSKPGQQRNRRKWLAFIRLCFECFCHPNTLTEPPFRPLPLMPLHHSCSKIQFLSHPDLLSHDPTHQRAKAAAKAPANAATTPAAPVGIPTASLTVVEVAVAMVDVVGGATLVAVAVNTVVLLLVKTVAVVFLLQSLSVSVGPSQSAATRALRPRRKIVEGFGFMVVMLRWYDLR